MRLYAVLFAVGLVVYGVVAGPTRLTHQSEAPHFVYQADAWLHGSVAVQPPLPNDDWAQVERVQLDDGSEAEGRRMTTRPTFMMLDGGTVETKRIVKSLGWTAYVSFPFVPSLIMVPSALIAGRGANDVLPTLVVAALILPLTLLLLRRLGMGDGDALWLVGALAFGSVLFFASVQGKVWYTAHVVGVALALVYVWGSIDASRPMAAGLALGAASLTRTAMAFMAPLFLIEWWRSGRDWKKLAWFAAPLIGWAIAGVIYNEVRFHSATEFGHTYLALGNHQPVRQQLVIETHGLASPHYLLRNLAVAFLQTPDLSPFKVNGHGMAIWLTSPWLVLLLLPRVRGPRFWTLWLCVALVALPSLTYMNSGWYQFGYRFSLDYMVLLVALLAIGGRPLGRVGKALIGVAIAVNLFGAVTFGRYWGWYTADYDRVHLLGGAATIKND